MSCLDQRLGREGKRRNDIIHILSSIASFHNKYIILFAFKHCRAHLENKFLLMKLPGTIEWLQRMKPSVVVYCPIWNRIAQVASLVLVSRLFVFVLVVCLLLFIF